MTNKNKVIGIFGIGIFTYLCISSISYIFEGFIRDILILFDAEPIVNFLVTELLSFTIFILPILVIIQKVSRNYDLITNKIGKYLVWSFVTFLILQIIYIAYPYIKDLLINDLFTNKETEYFSYMRKNYGLYFIKSAVYFLAMMISFLLIYKEFKNGSQQSV